MIDILESDLCEPRPRRPLRRRRHRRISAFVPLIMKRPSCISTRSCAGIRSRGHWARCSAAASAALCTGSFRAAHVTLASPATCNAPSRWINPRRPTILSPEGSPRKSRSPPARRRSALSRRSHAQITLQLLANPRDYRPGFTSLLFTLEHVPDVFDEMFRPIRFRIKRAPGCLSCGVQQQVSASELDAALDSALERINQ